MAVPVGKLPERLRRVEGQVWVVHRRSATVKAAVRPNWSPIVS
jgi:hypothetical protein